MKAKKPTKGRPPVKERKANFTVRFKPETLDALDRIVEAEGSGSRSALVQRAVEQFLKSRP